MSPLRRTAISPLPLVSPHSDSVTAIGSGELATPLHSISTSSIREHVTRFPLPEAWPEARIVESLQVPDAVLLLNFLS
jgi:hypothetical protein